MAKASRATIAELTLKVIEKGNYIPPNSTKPVELAHKFKNAQNNTLLYKPSDRAGLLRFARTAVNFDTSVYNQFSKNAHVAPQPPRPFDYPSYDESEESNDHEGESVAESDSSSSTTTTTASTTDTINIFNNSNNNNNNTKEKGKEPEKELEEKLKDLSVKDLKTYNTKIEVKHSTTLEAARELAQAGNRVCVLNFASAKNPGGGFLGGAQAQEESLARSSGLYPCLTAKRAYYEENSRDKTCVYTHHIIYSPEVPVFRSDDGDLLAQPYFPSFITAPAVNWGAAFHRVSGPEVLVRAMLERAAMLLGIAVKHNEETLVLGAWGCGVFAFPPEICAALFYNLLIPPHAPFYNMFKHIVFAITDKSLVDLFSNVMANGPLPLPAGGFQARGGGQFNNNNKNNKGGNKNNNNNRGKNDNKNNTKRR